jgi:PRTRC genetic system protein E
VIKQIMTLLAHCASVNILAVQTPEGALSLTFIPKAKEGGAASMAAPFNLTGSPEELESGIASALEKINGGRATLAEQVEATNTLLAQAAKDAAEEGSKALKGKPAKPAAPSKVFSATTADEDDSDDESTDTGNGDGDEKAATTPASSSGSVPAMNLFA